MRRLFVLTILLSAASAKAVDPAIYCTATMVADVNLLSTDGTAIYSNGSARFQAVHMWGAQWIAGDDGSVVAAQPFDTLDGQWQGSLMEPPPQLSRNTCFQGRISAATDDAAQGAGSPFSLACYEYHPPPSNGDILTVSDPCEPLVIDLNGDGVQTTGIDDMVWFDLDGNGVKDHLTWTKPNTQEGFLWVNLSGKNRVDNGSELFGIGTVMPNGSKAPDGFTALAMYDQPAQGGNGDGVIDASDGVWTKLRVWVDSNHDGVCDPGEVRPLAACNVDGISLTTVTANTVDAAGNRHELRSECWRKNGNRREPLDIESIGFQGTLH